ncbi:phosphatase PAP2 family protein [Streptomyces sp. KE1]|uniref:phosphatase PAP2 family protein n=1 Tax=Streptomyces sp. KE1 TaxID=1638939 RepID=UPI00063E95C3|nr:phosphatase PAP2 family protein [Streptomyces sp. KE1]KLI97896.1 prepilin peptidase [Streptomyces sp. KE1]
MTQQNAPARTRRPWISAPRCLLAFLAVYLLAVLTPFGQRAENALFGGEGARPAWIYGWSGAAYGSSAMPPLEYTALPTLVVGTALATAVALVRRRWWLGCAALGVIVATIGGKEIARAVLPRPDLVGARASLLETSFPSGHVAVPAALALAAVLVASPRVRPYVAAAGMLWLTVTAAAVLATYHHRPSDVLGTTLLACACHLLATRLLSQADVPATKRHPRSLPAVALALSACGALAAGARADSLSESLVFAATAFLCAALFWFTTAHLLPRRAPGPDHNTSPAPGRHPART